MNLKTIENLSWPFVLMAHNLKFYYKNFVLEYTTFKKHKFPCTNYKNVIPITN